MLGHSLVPSAQAIVYFIINVPGVHEVRICSRLSTSPNHGFLLGLTVPVGVHLLSKSS